MHTIGVGHASQDNPLDGPGDLDPDDWQAFGRIAHELVDDVVGWLSTQRERPPWQPPPADVRRRLAGPLPRAGEGLEAACEAFRRDVLPYAWGNAHPRFWGWVSGSGVPVAILADFLAAAMNSNVGAFEQSATYVEEQVLDWLKTLIDFPRETGALLTSGCSMASLIGLAAARGAKAPFDVRRHGLAAVPRVMTLYGSVDTHPSITKAVELLGLGRDSLRTVAVDRDHRIDLAALREEIRRDRSAGRQPIAVVGNAGTVDTGAIDDLEALAGICAAEDLWLHVDGAFGALAWQSAALRPALAGLQRADSLAFDLHKWMYLPIDVGCVFVRDGEELRGTFEQDAPYLKPTAGGLNAHPRRFSDLGIELTRRFRALKVWMALKAHGADEFARALERNLGQARYLADRVLEAPELELMAPVPLNVVTFRYAAGDLSHEALDELNTELLVRVQEGGVAVPSGTRIRGASALRAAITNHRSRREDFDALVEASVRIGNELLAERAGEVQRAC